MRVINERTFYYHEVKELLNKQIDIFIFGSGTDLRDQYFKTLLSPHSQKFLIFDYDLTNEAFTINGDEPKSITQSLYIELADRLKGTDRRIFVDITSMPIALMFNLVKELKELNCSLILFGYTKPLVYKKKLQEFPSTKTYNLTEKFIGIKALPGFVRSGDPDKRDKLLVIFLGYEGDRAGNIYDVEDPDDNSTVIVIGFPGYRPGWQDITFEANLNLLKQEFVFDFVQYVTAESPFEAYNLLVNLKEMYSDRNLVISPIGPKTHALGVALFAIEDEESTILYDNPIESKGRSDEVEEGLVFDLTCLLGA